LYRQYARKISYPQKHPYKAVDKSEFFKWIKCFAHWLFSAQFFAGRAGGSLAVIPTAGPQAALRRSVRNDLA
jgi:hypothetical protein